MSKWATRQKQKAFTIVELLIVIVVIAILAAIVVVAYNGIQNRARGVALTSDLSGISRAVQLQIVAEPGGVNSILDKYHQINPNVNSAWVVGEGAENLLTENQLRWNDVPGLPKLQTSPGSTIEIIFKYRNIDLVTPEVTQNMLANNMFCIPGAAPGTEYDYVPWSAIHEDYDKMLYFDSGLSRVATIEEIAQAHQNEQAVACIGHVARWTEATQAEPTL